MRKLLYKFEDGIVVKTLNEAKTRKETLGIRYEEFLVTEPEPVDSVEDGVSFERASRLREIPGLKQIDTGNLAQRGYFVSSKNSVLQATLKAIEEKKVTKNK